MILTLYSLKMCLGGCFLCISSVVCGGSLACWGHLRDCICVADSLDIFSSKFILYKSLRAGISWRLSAPGLYSACEPKGGWTRTDSFRCSLPFLSALGPKGGDGFLLSTALFTAVCGKCADRLRLRAAAVSPLSGAGTRVLKNAYDLSAKGSVG